MSHARRQLTVASAVVALSLTPVAALAAAGGSAAGSGHVKVVGNCRKPAYEPHRIILTCGDANAYLVHIRYATWTHKAATGTARLVVNDCTPNCAAGSFTHRSVTIRLKDVTGDHGQKVFSKVVTTTKKGHRRTWQPGI
jgi:hypothetical protein